MTKINCNNISAHTCGDIVSIGSPAPEFVLTASDFSLVSLNDYAGQALLIHVYVSVDTDACIETCDQLSQLNDGQYNVLAVSMDLPFALARLEQQNRFPNTRLLSDFRTREFGEAYNLTIIDGPLAGLLARNVIVIDKNHHIIYQELCKEVTEPPNIELAFEALKDCT